MTTTTPAAPVAIPHSGRQPESPKQTPFEHRGVEMMAKGGKLIHVRQTRSFRDVE